MPIPCCAEHVVGVTRLRTHTGSAGTEIVLHGLMDRWPALHRTDCSQTDSSHNWPLNLVSGGHLVSEPDGHPGMDADPAIPVVVTSSEDARCDCSV